MHKSTNQLNEILSDFFNKYHTQYIQKGEIFIRADEEPKGIFFIREGAARRYFVSMQGYDVTLNIYKKFSFFPMSWAMNNTHNLHYYEAMTDMKVSVAPKSQVILFVQNNSDVLYDLLKRVYIGMEGIWQHIEYLMIGDSYAKVLATILMLAKRFGILKDNNVTIIDLQLTEKDLAAYAGVSRETVSRELTKAKKKKLLLFEKEELTILNMREIERELLFDY